MRHYSAVFKLTTGLLMAASLCAPSYAGTLYQWTGKDGTPTYSPDPPPAGVKYELVGDDLKPLPKNVDMSKPVKIANKPAAANRASNASVAPAQQPAAQTVIPQPMAKKPVTPWKPVRYANDPTPRAKKPVKAPKRTQDPAAVASVSPECKQARQKMVLLESQFAQALTDEQMDAAVLQLSAHKPALQSACNIN